MSYPYPPIYLYSKKWSVVDLVLKILINVFVRIDIPV
jgi:hypothetical protein